MSRTPSQLAKDEHVGRSKVMSWIHTGELVAFNVGESGAPRYRISDEAWREFQEKRLVKPAVEKPPNRRITNRTTKQFF